MPGMPAPAGPAGMPGAPGPRGPGGPVPDLVPDEGLDKSSPSDSATNDVRSNFPETWIWTETATRCVA